jgi:NAD(P)-dependent dehydrogenase (short-subunit alcohol dehydrogenase family)
MTGKILILGASRGIGLELVRQYRAVGAAVTGTAREDAGLERLQTLGAKAVTLDVTKLASASSLAWLTDGEAYDTVILSAGVYGPRTQGLEPPTPDDFNFVMHTNVWAAMALLPQVLPALEPGARLAVISSRMGSIGGREATGGWLYRASKAALNSVLKDVSLELEGKAICVALHPGWVRTDMGGDGADLSVEQSVSDMRRTLAALGPADNGRFFNHNGQPLDW